MPSLLRQVVLRPKKNPPKTKQSFRSPPKFTDKTDREEDIKARERRER